MSQYFYNASCSYTKRFILNVFFQCNYVPLIDKITLDQNFFYFNLQNKKKKLAVQSTSLSSHDLNTKINILTNERQNYHARF